ncbi:MAG TPA: glutathionylspermidine synthase family protein [Candidatus Limnocylindria bacterium]|nr:glutathionylspermidine synthase family protein [Candidatus Limnocylindria bacterium]
MQRHSCTARPNWRECVEEIGLTYHTHETAPYWDETAYYELTAAEVDTLEAAANTLHALCIEAAGAVIERDWWSRLAIPPAAIPAIRDSWEHDDFSLYGRFDLAWNGQGAPKLLEYNADTPTALLEASVAQWFWLQQNYRGADQFNSIHERLIAAWKTAPAGPVHFTAVRDNLEDAQTVHYLRDTCAQAGRVTKELPLEEVGWNGQRQTFMDLEDEPITNLFKLYPWEWLWGEPFAELLPARRANFIEPCWKMLLSNKGLLPVLWELFPGHPNLLPAYTSPEPLGGSYARKPLLSREGANVSLVANGEALETSAGSYGEEGFIYQALAPLADFGGNHPVLGAWIVNHEAAGLGIREDTRLITGNLSRFVPHLFSP